MQDTLFEGTARAAQLAPSAVTASAVGGSATRGVVGRVSPTTSGSSRSTRDCAALPVALVRRGQTQRNASHNAWRRKLQKCLSIKLPKAQEKPVQTSRNKWLPRFSRKALRHCPKPSMPEKYKRDDWEATLAVKKKMG